MSRFEHSSSPDDRIARARNELREQAAALEADAARGRERLAELRTETGAAEERAMAAVRDGRDDAVRDALRACHAGAEEAAAIEADLRVLEAILAECHAYLNAPPPPTSAPPRDPVPPPDEP